MREIKFRAIQRGTKKFIYGDLCKFMDNSHCIMPSSFFATRDFGNEDNNGNIKIENCLAIGGFYPVDSETIGQLTGLKDKNGIDIYEGDILSITDNTGDTYFYNIEWKPDCYMMVGDGGPGEWLSLEEFEGCVIVGNKYENPQLNPR